MCHQNHNTRHGMTVFGAHQWVWTWIRTWCRFGFVRAHYRRRVWCHWKHLPWKSSVSVPKLSSMARPDIRMSFLPLPAIRRPSGQMTFQIYAPFYLQELFLAFCFLNDGILSQTPLPANNSECMTLSTVLRAGSGQLLYSSSLATPALFRSTIHIQMSHCLCANITIFGYLERY